MSGAQLVRLPGRIKIGLTVAADALFLSSAVLLAYGLRHASYEKFGVLQIWLAASALILGPGCLWLCGLYREITRYLGPEFVVRVVKGCALVTLVLIATAFMYTATREGSEFPRTMPVIFFLLSMLGVGGMRLMARWILLRGARATRGSKAAIYGAGAAGVGLHAALAHAGTHQVVAYFDDSPSLQGRHVRGVPVHAGADLQRVIAGQGVEILLLALPSASRTRRRQIVEQATKLGASVLTVPTLSEIQDGTATVDQLRPVRIEELLGRPPAQPNQELLRRLIAGRQVLVTGAGGSIGSELCRRIIANDPTTLVLLDASEQNLYEIERELREELARRRSAIRLEAVLASVCDEVAMERVCRTHRVQMLYHAAAYKHVPIVERNECAGVETNLFGTITAAQVAARAGVESFVLISTDKAVRPTSVMGTTKRLAEMALQAMQAQGGHRMTICQVRFGNVLGSSGSVIPLFREQIQRGGPVTVTHADMVRYFMTIPEAADLVIQAGTMAKGGEVFVLDMGEPVRIDDLARNMIRLAGRSVRDAANPHGDIEIIYTGVRPGEKLYEELFIQSAPAPTAHPTIGLGAEPFLPWPELEPQLSRLRAAVDQHDQAAVRQIIAHLMQGGGSFAQRAPQGSQVTQNFHQ
jgi:FlaA1/EpsC-like NDP-sugar epimerase